MKLLRSIGRLFSTVRLIDECLPALHRHLNQVETKHDELKDRLSSQV